MSWKPGELQGIHDQIAKPFTIRDLNTRQEWHYDRVGLLDRIENGELPDAFELENRETGTTMLVKKDATIALG